MTGLLFDISPEEPEKKRKGGKKKATAPPPAPPAAVTEVFDPPPALGVVRGEQCENPSCGGAFHDVIEKSKAGMKIQCAYCGWIKTVYGAEASVQEEGEFVFRKGRFSGMTLAQTAKVEGSEAYIRWAADGHEDESVRKACRLWLDSIGYATPQGNP